MATATAGSGCRDVRYYRIVITDPASGSVVTPPGFSGLLGGATYTSFVNGQSLPGAWNIELDVPVIGQATPQGQALCRVWGISRQEVGQANNLAGKNIQIFAGMQKGLPLANPAQAGLIVQGIIFQPFGNWVGVDQSLDFVIVPGSSTASQPGGLGTLAAPKNLVLNWMKGMALGAALQTCLAIAFPNQKVRVNVSPQLIRSYDEVGFFPTLEQLAMFCRAASLDIIKTTGYAGVTIVPAPNNTIAVFDNVQAASAAAKQISFQDLIGQPTWIQAPNIQLKTVMRADLSVGQVIKMPPTIVTNTAAAASSLLNQQATFQGTFLIVNMRHVGNFRNPAGDAWVTVIEAAPNQLGT